MLVLQSHGPDAPAWVRRCVASVRAWAGRVGADHRLEGDTLFDRLPPALAARDARGPVRADLARLLWIRDELASGRWERVAWLDADVFVFAPDRLDLSTAGTHAFGRETWVEVRPDGREPRVRRHVHNAVCVFGPGDPVLPFLIHVAGGLLARAAPGRTSPQIIGPKMLTHLHGVADFPLIESVGMASPPVLRDLATGGGPAWDTLRQAHEAPLAALNLCASLVGRTVDGVTVTDGLLTAAMDGLMDRMERGAPATTGLETHQP
ncbi:hypothetical protein [Rhodospira trueperi]|uniref:hypothetical protein n=1 Tax=Rhodospira trueperi TaxID=69960 RepID=UPI00115FEB0D|nr:hypothetical protein [Rhodospira trueperi]